ncbi:hypothetical protein YC2023_067631 [Brassica napus]
MTKAPNDNCGLSSVEQARFLLLLTAVRGGVVRNIQNLRLRMVISIPHRTAVKVNKNLYIYLGMSTEGLSRGPGPFKPVPGRVWA